MSARTARLLEEALALDPEDRVDLADRLLASLDSAYQKRIDELWAREVEDRLDALDRGEIKTVPAEDVFRAIRNEMTK